MTQNMVRVFKPNQIFQLMVFQMKCLHFENYLKQLNFQFTFDSICFKNSTTLSVQLSQLSHLLPSCIGKEWVRMECKISSPVSLRLWIRLVLKQAQPAGEVEEGAAWEISSVSTYRTPKQSEANVFGWLFELQFYQYPQGHLYIPFNSTDS